MRETLLADRRTLSGYMRAAAVIERERMERLARMTPEEARAIYDDLCWSWATWGKAHDLAVGAMAAGDAARCAGSDGLPVLERRRRW